MRVGFSPTIEARASRLAQKRAIKWGFSPGVFPAVRRFLQRNPESPPLHSEQQQPH